jgi:hypothetical protein
MSNALRGQDGRWQVTPAREFFVEMSPLYQSLVAKSSLPLDPYHRVVNCKN